jgi:hypothetical protein
MRSVNREGAGSLSGGEVSILEGRSCLTAAEETRALMNCACCCIVPAAAVAEGAESESLLHELFMQAGVIRGCE